MSSASDTVVPTRASLLARIKDWDDDISWREFCSIYRGLIHGFARKRGLSEAEAEDVVQETFVSVARSIREFRYDPKRCAFKSWLMQLTWRRVADHFRRTKRNGSALLATGAKLADISDGTDLERAWEEEWERALIEAAMDDLRTRLEPSQFKVFHLHVIRGQEAKAVAKALGVTRAYVYLMKHRLQNDFARTLRRLRDQWGG